MCLFFVSSTFLRKAQVKPRVYLCQPLHELNAFAQRCEDWDLKVYWLCFWLFEHAGSGHSSGSAEAASWQFLREETETGPEQVGCAAARMGAKDQFQTFASSLKVVCLIIEMALKKKEKRNQQMAKIKYSRFKSGIEDQYSLKREKKSKSRFCPKPKKAVQGWTCNADRRTSKRIPGA